MSSPLSKSERQISPLPSRIHRRQHSTLWFPDGNIILVAQNTMFRVYRGILSKQSDVFKGMFSLPECGIGEDQETYQGVPIVQMHDDPVDLAHLLSVLYDYLYYVPFRPCEVTLVAALLRLSTKYQIHSLRQQTLAHFVQEFPFRLGDFDANADRDDDVLTWRTERSKKLDLVALAREVNAPMLLPTILYRTLYLSPSVFSIKESLKTVLSTFEKIPSTEDRLTCMIARERIRSDFQYQFHSLFAEEEPERRWSPPARGDTVQNNVCCWDAKAGKLFVGEKVYQDAMTTCTVFERELFEDMRMNALTLGCEKCMNRYDTTAKRARTSLWRHLPKYFGLGSWQELVGESGFELEKDEEEV